MFATLLGGVLINLTSRAFSSVTGDMVANQEAKAMKKLKETEGMAFIKPVLLLTPAQAEQLSKVLIENPTFNQGLYRAAMSKQKGVTEGQ